MLKLGIEPLSYGSNASTAYVVVLWPSFLFDSFVKIWATCEFFLGKWFTAPPPLLAKKFPYAYACETCQITSSSQMIRPYLSFYHGLYFLQLSQCFLRGLMFFA